MRSPAPTPTEARIDLHLHSRASTDTGSWFLNRAYMPESYTEPEAAYGTAKARGMDLVALTDHNTISGALEIAHHPDVVIGVEVTATFPEDRVPVHVLVWGLSEWDWAEIDRLRGNLYEMCDMLAAADLPHALAHPLHRVGAELTADHLERCLLLFRIWEGRNGARPAATNEAATRLARSSSADLLVRLAEKHGIAPRASGPPALTGGSDDHSGFDVARAWTVTPPAAGPADLVDHLRMGRVRPAGEDGTGMGLAHSVGSLAAKAWLERGTVAIPDGLRGIATELLGHAPAAPDPAAAAPSGAMAEEVLARLRADRRLVRRYRKLGRGGDDRGARHHARLRLATGWLHDELVRRAVERPLMRARGLGARAESLAGAGILALPYLMAAGYARAEERFAAALERDFLGPSLADPGPARVLMLTDTFNETNGVAGTMRRLADHADARPGCGLRVVTCGAGGRERAGHLDLRALTDVPLPVYGDASWRLGVPSVIELLEAVEDSRAEVIHAATPGPLGLAGLLVARTLGIPFVASHHTELARYVLELTGDRLAAGVADRATRWFLGQAERVHVPTHRAAEGLVESGIPAERLVLFGRGTDHERFDPDLRSGRMRRRLGGRDATLALYVGRLSREKGVLHMADAFRRATPHCPGLRLAIVGDGPARVELGRALAGTPHRFMGTLRGDELAEAYASADLLCLPSETETFGQVVTEAAASALPAVVMDRGAAGEHVVHGRSGLVVEAGAPEALAAAMALLHGDPALRERLGAGALRVAASRPGWDDVFDELLRGYPALLGDARPGRAPETTDAAAAA